MSVSIDLVLARQLFAKLSPHYSSVQSSPHFFFFSFPASSPSDHPGSSPGWWISLAPAAEGFVVRSACGIRTACGIWLDSRSLCCEESGITMMREHLLMQLQELCHHHGWPLIQSSHGSKG